LKERAQALPAGSRVLDAGAGEGPYRHLFDHVAYESADFLKVPKAYDPPTYVCDLMAIPVEDGRFDCIIATQVLAHVPDPASVLREFNRILRNGGEVWLSTPLFYEENEVPYDFYRYTQYGIQHLADQAGLAVAEIAWLEGYCGTLAYQLGMASRELRSPESIESRLASFALRGSFATVAVTFGLLARVFSRLDQRYKITSQGMCKNYRCVLVKV
jgi:SAM-dependent methyltransferase